MDAPDLGGSKPLLFLSHAGADIEAARRLKARVRREKGTEFVHTLNGTAFAIGRTLAAIMETHQREDGTIAVPEALHAFGAPKVMDVSRPKAAAGV